MLPTFIYKFNKGPTEKEFLGEPIKEGDCRLAIQLYFYKIHNLFIESDKILCPRSYKETGVFIWREGEQNFLEKIKIGDVIYAERIKDKNKVAILRDRNYFKSEDEWIIALHTAIYFDKNLIWHATAIEGQTCYWDLSKFLEFYKPVAVKRFLN